MLRAALLVTAVGIGVRLALPPGEALVPVAVAARDVPAGAALTSEDVRLVSLPARGVPQGTARSAGPVIGQRAAIDLPAGFVLVPAALTSGRFGAEPPPGTVVVPVSLDGADAMRVGDTIELVPGSDCPTEQGPWSVTALVVGPMSDPADSTTPSGTTGGLGLGGATALVGGTDLGRTLVAVEPESGRKIAALAPSCRFGAAIMP